MDHLAYFISIAEVAVCGYLLELSNVNQGRTTETQTSAARSQVKTSMNVVDMIEADVEYEGQQSTQDLVLVGGDGPSLLGHDWL